MNEVKFRLANPALRAAPDKARTAGWAGKPEPRADGSEEYAWHCVPFTEGAQHRDFLATTKPNKDESSTRTPSSSHQQ